MASIADGWWNEERRQLVRSLEAIASEAPNPDRIGLCLDTILNDLELYDDPRQGVGAWLYGDELQLAERLGEKLHAAVEGGSRLVEAGATPLASRAWPEARATATHLLQLMDTNGDLVP
jgi:hypothetical protein